MRKKNDSDYFNSEIIGYMLTIISLKFYMKNV